MHLIARHTRMRRPAGKDQVSHLCHPPYQHIYIRDHAGRLARRGKRHGTSLHVLHSLSQVNLLDIEIITQRLAGSLS